MAADLLDRIAAGEPLPAGSVIVRQTHAWLAPQCFEVLVDDEQVGAWSLDSKPSEAARYVLRGLGGAAVLTATLTQRPDVPQGNLPAAISDARGEVVGRVSHKSSVLDWRRAILVHDSAGAELVRFKIGNWKLTTPDGSVEIRQRSVPTGKGTVPAAQRTLTTSGAVPQPLAALLLAVPFVLMIHGADREPGERLSSKERWGSIGDGLSGLGNIS